MANYEEAHNLIEFCLIGHVKNVNQKDNALSPLVDYIKFLCPFMDKWYDTSCELRSVLSYTVLFRRFTCSHGDPMQPPLFSEDDLYNHVPPLLQCYHSPHAILCTKSGLRLLGIRSSPVICSSTTALQNLALSFQLRNLLLSTGPGIRP